jgi:hypothetical protein
MQPMRRESPYLRGIRTKHGWNDKREGLLEG